MLSMEISAPGAVQVDTVERSRREVSARGMTEVMMLDMHRGSAPACLAQIGDSNDSDVKTGATTGRAGSAEVMVVQG